jgi:antagonist of KipI
MGKLRVIKSGSMATIQDKGRFGFRQFGIPQSGAMDLRSMKEANYLTGNQEDYPVIEFALAGLKLEAMEDSIIGIVGASVKVNSKEIEGANWLLKAGDVLEISHPDQVYGYLSIGGLLNAKLDFGSYSTYTMAGFGGIEGRPLKSGDILETDDDPTFEPRAFQKQTSALDNVVAIRIMKGPEWNMLKELPDGKTFTIDPASNRMGIRLSGATIKCDGSEIISSAVIPGTIQLPANGQPIILMNDCQTTGGYPRIGKVIEEDMGKLAQVKSNQKIHFHIFDEIL